MQELTSSMLSMLQCVHTRSWAHEAHLSAFLHILCRYGKGQTLILISSDDHW